MAGTRFASFSVSPVRLGPDGESHGEVEHAVAIDDLTFDVITVLQRKAAALDAYEKYIGDARAEDDGELEDLFSQMLRHDEDSVLALKEVLAHRLDEELDYEDEDDDRDTEDYDDVETVDEVDAVQPDSPEPPRGESNERQR